MSLPDLLKDVRPSDRTLNPSINSLPLESLPCKQKPRTIDVSSEDSGLAGGLRYSDREGGSRSGSFDDTRSLPSFGSCDSLSSLDEGEATWDALGRMSSIRRSTRFDKPQLITVEIARGESGFGVELEGERPPVLASTTGNALKTAMRIGDKLLEVNGESVKLMNCKEAGMLIDLEPQSVVLLFQRFKPTPVPSGKVVYSGWLNKRGGTGMTPRNWRRRWFVVRDDCIAYYYSSPEDTAGPLGAVVLHGYTISKANSDLKKPYSFKAIKGGARTYYFAGDSDEEMKRWAQVFTEAAGLEEREEVRILQSAQNVSVSALSIKNPDCHGFLRKQERGLKGWKRRYCVLKSGQLFLYGNMSNRTAYEVININGYEVVRGKAKDKKYYFQAVPPRKDTRTVSFYADYESERERWVDALNKSTSHKLKDHD